MRAVETAGPTSETLSAATPSPPPHEGPRGAPWLVAAALGLALAGGVGLFATRDVSPEPIAVSASPELEQARAAILAAELSEAQRWLGRVPESDPRSLSYEAVILGLRGDMAGENRVLSRAVSGAGGTDPWARAVALAARESGGDVADAQRESWGPLLGQSDDPMVAVLHLVVARRWQTSEERARALAEARARHPEHAIFGLMELTRKDASGDSTTMDALIEGLRGEFPTVAAFQVAWSRRLVRRGMLEAAEEVLMQAARLAPEDAEAQFELGHLKALTGDEAGRISQLIRSTSEAVPQADQLRYLREHGEVLVGVGRWREALKTWTADLGFEGDIVAHQVAVQVRASRAATLLQLDEAIGAVHAAEARTQMGGAEHASEPQRSWEAALAYDDAVRAVRSGHTEVLERRLERLREVGGTATRLVALLELEVALAEAGASPEQLREALQVVAPELAGDCAAAWMTARVAARAGDLEVIAAQAEVLASGACSGASLERALYRAEVETLLAEVASAVGRAAEAEAALSRLQTLWADPDPDLPLTLRLRALAHPGD